MKINYLTSIILSIIRLQSLTTPYTPAMPAPKPSKHVLVFDLTVSSDRSDYEDLLKGEHPQHGDVHILNECDMAFGGTGAIFRVVDFIDKGDVPAPVYSAPIC